MKNKFATPKRTSNEQKQFNVAIAAAKAAKPAQTKSWNPKTWF